MGLNAYFTYTVVKGMGVPWETALGTVFLSGVAFLILTLVGIRQWIIAAIPPALYAAVSAGIGLFIAFIGLRNTGIVKADPATIVTMGNLREPATALAAFGILTIAALREERGYIGSYRLCLLRRLWARFPRLRRRRRWWWWAA
jgi:adenine/guanine/hypoxanthine permease